jgi:hypothetical protein
MLKHLITLLLATTPLLAQTVGYNTTSRQTSPGDLIYRAGTNLTGRLVVSNSVSLPANSIALGTTTTGNYAAGDAEAGAATSGDSATAFFASGTLEDALLPASMANKTFTGTLTVPDNSIALGTKTTGNYAAGDAEAGAATSGDSATAFFSAGTLETARLGSGTANSSTFLRGDQTWATPSGSSDNWTAVGTTNSSLSGIATAHDFIATNSATIGSAAGVTMTGSNGTLTILGAGDGQDEDFKFDLNSTANTAVITSTTGMATWDFGTSWVFKLGTIEVGHATDTTVSRGGAGQLLVEGVEVVMPASTNTFTNKTYDASASGNVLKQPIQLNLQRPDYGDGAGAVPQTNAFNVSGLMHYTLSGNAETNANWIVYEFDCPNDLDTGVEMTARFAFLSGGTDTDDYVFHLTYAQQAPGAAYVTGTSISTSPIVMTVTPTTPANGDLQQSSATTLTGWASALTAGRPMQIRIARLQNAQDDSARDVQLVITYGSTR